VGLLGLAGAHGGVAPLGREHDARGHALGPRGGVVVADAAAHPAGDRGPAQAPYPATYGASIKPDGTIGFPDNTSGKIKGSSIYVSGAAVATLTEGGEVSGSGLKHKYKFNDKGELLDEAGHGVRVAPQGGVRGIGGKWRYRDVMVWAAVDADKQRWDYSGWRAVTIVSLIVVENMVPDAIR
jgi:hypothetical protein